MTRVSAGPFTLELPPNGVAILYEADEGGTEHRLPGGVGYLEALVQFAGEVIRLTAMVDHISKDRDAAEEKLRLANTGGLPLLYDIRRELGWNDKTSLSILADGVRRVRRALQTWDTPTNMDLEELARSIKARVVDLERMNVENKTRIEELLEELAASGWRTMESAPKDRHVIIAVGDEPPVYVSEAYYDAGAGAWYKSNTSETDAFDGRIYDPLGWQPLPSPPSEPRT